MARTGFGSFMHPSGVSFLRYSTICGIGQSHEDFFTCLDWRCRMLQFDSLGDCVRCLFNDIGAVAVFCSYGHNICELQEMGRAALDVERRVV